MFDAGQMGGLQRERIVSLAALLGACAIVPAGLLHFLGPREVHISSEVHFLPIAVSAGLAAAAAVAAIVSLGVVPVIEPYDEMRDIQDRLVDEIPNRGTTRVDGTTFDALAFKAGSVYALRRAGREVVATGAAQVLGSDYDPARGFTRVVLIDAGKPSALPQPPPGQQIARLGYRATDGTPRVVVVTLSAAR